MSLQHALRFIAQTRTDDELRQAVASLPADASLELCVQLGAARDLVFSCDELRNAHARDWTMRRFHTLARRAGTSS